MPYYCTVPRCTSMAGKAENVSFHQFPRDEELAKLWNKILKRGKPYTKYSKVCSLHFKPEDYTITSVGKNKGQWRTLRKDAIPSQNLPSETPAPSHHRTRHSGAWVPSNLAPNAIDSRMQQQVAQAIYMQTMLAMQVATNDSNPTPPQSLDTADLPQTSAITLSDIEKLFQKRKSPRNSIDENQDLDQEQGSNPTPPQSLDTADLPQTSAITLSDIEQILQKRKSTRNSVDENQDLDQGKELTSYKCQECFKCFKDPDVFMLHKRSHIRNVPEQGNEKENLNSNSELARQDTLRANPILANLLKSGIAPANELRDTGVFDVNNVLSIENQIMTALTTNMEAYIRNLSSMLSHQTPQVSENGQNSGHSEQNSENGQHSGHSDQNSEDSHNFVEDNDSMDAQNHVRSANFAQEYDNFLENVHNSTQDVQNFVANDQNSTPDVQNLVTNVQNSAQDVQNLVSNDQNFTAVENSDRKRPTKVDRQPNCDNQDLNDSKDSNNLVIDETV